MYVPRGGMTDDVEVDLDLLLAILEPDGLGMIEIDEPTEGHSPIRCHDSLDAHRPGLVDHSLEGGARTRLSQLGRHGGVGAEARAGAREGNSTGRQHAGSDEDLVSCFHTLDPRHS